MCGIIGYTGKQNVLPILLKGLEHVEYRGYDSAGIAIENSGGLQIFKNKGGPRELSSLLKNEKIEGMVGIGHTRWATHGEPSNINAHPHFSCDKKTAVVHNGIIENYLTLKEGLVKRGHHFTSETDTEVIVHLIEDIQKNEGVSFPEAVRLATQQLQGSFSILAVSHTLPKQVIAAMSGGVLLIGLGKDEFFVASDPSSVIEFTKDVVYLNDGELAILEPGKELEIMNISNKKSKTPYFEKLEMEIEEIEKGGYAHFMLKEIHEQPLSLTGSMRGRLNNDGVRLGGIWEFKNKIARAKKIVFIGCGTSWHAGLIGEYLIEKLARIPVEVEYASEFRYRNPILGPNDIVIAISQSGETADTLAGIQLAKSLGATVLGICNVVGSTIARSTDAGIYLHAGPEIGVASTKAFTSQVTVLILLALLLGQETKNVSTGTFTQIKNELEALPTTVKKVLELEPKIKEIAETFKTARNFLYLGRGMNFPAALEGALKLKEISYIHAEGYPAAEMKHGPIALIDENMPVVVIATNDQSYEKILSNVQEIKARKGKVIAIVTEGDQKIKTMSDYTIEIPKGDNMLTPIIASIPLQLLAYHMAIILGHNPDKPRNLAKSVTVE